jgi:small-conductance mechanosensitive channel
MRLAGPAARLIAALVFLAVVSWPLVQSGTLPIAPHAMPPGDGRWRAQLLGSLWWLVIAANVSGVVSLLVAGTVAGPHRRPELRFVSDLGGILAFSAAAVAMSAFVFELPVSTVFATSSILAVILGFALQNTVGDLLSGFAMSIEQPFHIGERIALDERTTGRVVEMNWRATRLLAVSGDVIIVPNSVLSRARIINHDARIAPHHRYSVEVKVSNEIAPERAMDLLRLAAVSAEGVLATPAPRVDLAASGEWWMNYKILFYFKDWGDDAVIASRVLSAAWTHLSWAGIPQPVPRTMFARGAARVDDLDPIVALLSHVAIFQPLDAAERRQLAAGLQAHHVSRGTQVIEQGSEGRSLFIVREGVFSVSLREGESERIVAQLHPGDFVGEASLLTGAPRNASVTALSDGSVYEVDKRHLEPLLRERPALVNSLGQVLEERAAVRLAASAANGAASRNSRAHLANQIWAFFRG